MPKAYIQLELVSEDEEDLKDWLAWYLDGGGEQTFADRDDLENAEKLMTKSISIFVDGKEVRNWPGDCALVI